MFEGQRNYERTGHGVKSNGTKETSSVIPFNFTVRKLSVRGRAPESTITLSPPILRVFEFLRVVKARDISRDFRGGGERGTGEIRLSSPLTFKSDTPSAVIATLAATFDRRVREELFGEVKEDFLSDGMLLSISSGNSISN